MSLAADVIEQLRAALVKIAGARSGATAARERAVEIRLEVQAATDGSSAEKPAEACVRLEQAQVKLDEAVAEFDAGTVAVEEYISALGGTGAGTGSSPAAGPTTRPTKPVTPAFRPMRADPDKRDEISPYVGLGYAVATLWDANGRQVVGPHQASDDGPAATADWRAPWRDYPRLRRHVEAHAAARLRPGDTMVMYINIAPCTYSDGCKVNLCDIIPKGATLWVHLVRPSGTVDVKAYRGTGRAYE